MGESIRSLTVKLGYDVDMSGANMFRSSFKNLNKSLGGLSSGYEKNLKRMGAANKRFVITAGDLVNGIKKVLNAGKKVFVAFSSIQQARVTLGFRTSTEEADDLIKRVSEITKATGGYVSQLDAINAISFGGNITDEMPFFVENLDKIIKLSKVAGKDFKSTSDAIANFIATGQGLDQLVEFEIISAKEKEALVKSGTAELIGKQGITARTAQAGRFLESGAPKVDEFFKAFEKTGGAAIDKFGTSVEDLNIVVGKRLNPVVVGMVKDLTTLADSLKGGTLFSDSLKRNSEQFNKDFETVKGLLFGPSVNANKSNNGGSSQSNDNSTTTNIINVNGAEDAEVVARKVEAKIAKKIIKSSISREIPQALNTIVQPSASP